MVVSRSQTSHFFDICESITDINETRGLGVELRHAYTQTYINFRLHQSMLPSFDLERRFSRNATLAWTHVWWTQCFYVSAVYVVLVHLGQRLMKHRKKFILRRPLFLWNFMLAVFSAIGFYRVAAPFVADLRR